MNETNQEAINSENNNFLSDEELELMVHGTNACSIGSVPNTCQMQSNKY
jgi:hypothetical protein